MSDAVIVDEIDLAAAEAEPYSEDASPAEPLSTSAEPAAKRARYYRPWPSDESADEEADYAWLSAERAKDREARRLADLPNRPPKTRNGGFHGDLLPGEVGPCTRCGWVWYPDMRTLRKSDYPHRCSNCRSPDWRIPPKRSFASTPASPKWLAKRAGASERRRMRRAKRLAELAAEFGKRLVDASAPPLYTREELRREFSTPPQPPSRSGHVIPPPPGMEEGE